MFCNKICTILLCKHYLYNILPNQHLLLYSHAKFTRTGEKIQNTHTTFDGVICRLDYQAGSIVQRRLSVSARSVVLIRMFFVLFEGVVDLSQCIVAYSVFMQNTNLFTALDSLNGFLSWTIAEQQMRLIFFKEIFLIFCRFCE